MQMQKNCHISLYLDTRRPKSNGKCPVKLRVYIAEPRRQKLYATIFDLSEEEFEEAWLVKKVKPKFRQLRRKLLALETRASQIADELQPFTLSGFEKRLYRKPGDGTNLHYIYENTISKLRSRGQVSTAETYELARKSLSAFIGKNGSRSFEKHSLRDVSPDLLRDYEKYMLSERSCSTTTISIYLRTLRALFNQAIDDLEIDREHYPFGKRKYQIPTSKNLKRALNQQQLKALYQAKPETIMQEKAKDFWFFSYACNGMNMKDILLLRYEYIKDDRIHFRRAKTKTKRDQAVPITVYLTAFTKSIIKKYGQVTKKGTGLIFEIVKDNMTPTQQQAAIKNFTRYVNQHLKKMVATIDVPGDISTYWARHTFATLAIQKGASMEFVQESLGHSDLRTTQNYFAGFDDDLKKDFATKLLDFKNF